MPIEEYTDEGILNLAYAILEQSTEECESSIRAGDYINARIIADRDSRGIVGKILSFAAGNPNYLEEYVNKEINNFSQLKRW